LKVVPLLSGSEAGTPSKVGPLLSGVALVLSGVEEDILLMGAHSL
jgi:hypothetical protein